MRTSKYLLLGILLLSLSCVAAQGQVLPEPPRQYVDTAPVKTRGRTFRVAEGEDLQLVFNRARRGDQIILGAEAVFFGNFYLRDVPQGKHGEITIRSEIEETLPEGVRVTPAAAARMPKIISPNNEPALNFYPSGGGFSKAHHVRVIGIEITTSAASNYTLVQIGGQQTEVNDSPSDIIIDRTYIHGLPGSSVTRGVALQGVRVAIINSYVSDVHGFGFDTQAICGWNGAGPFKIVNNYLEAAGENFMLGGADPSTVGLVPSDIEFRLNDCVKLVTWNPQHPSYAGRRWSIKNLFELKNAKRVLVDSNTFRNNWVDAQSGVAILFTPRNQDNTAPWSTVEDVTFTNNLVDNSAAGLSISGTDDIHPSLTARRILIARNRFTNIGAADLGFNGRLFQLLDGPVDVTIEDNEGAAWHSFLVFDGASSVNLTVLRNTFDRGEYGAFGSGSSEGMPSLNLYAPGYVFVENLILHGQSVAHLYPPGNYFTN